jgi:hypothetical protein
MEARVQRFVLQAKFAHEMIGGMLDESCVRVTHTVAIVLHARAHGASESLLEISEPLDLLREPLARMRELQTLPRASDARRNGP